MAFFKHSNHLREKLQFCILDALTSQLYSLPKWRGVSFSPSTLQFRVALFKSHLLGQLGEKYFLVKYNRKFILQLFLSSWSHGIIM